MAEVSGFTRFLGEARYDQRALVVPRASGAGAALFRIDQENPPEVEIDIPPGLIMVCVHLDGKIDWRSYAVGDRRRHTNG